MRIFFKTFIQPLLYSKTTTALNILGLVLAFCVFIVITREVLFEFSFDTFHPRADHIFRLEIRGENTTKYDGYVLAEEADRLIGLSSQIEEMALLYSSSKYCRYVYENNSGEQEIFEEKNNQITLPFTQIFNFQMVEGDLRCLEEASTAIISASLARRLWKNESAIGKTLEKIEAHVDWRSFIRIGGVYKDFPANSTISNYIYTPKDSPLMGGGMYFVLTDLSAQKEILEQIRLKKILIERRGKCDIRLNPVSALYFSQDTETTGEPKGNKQKTYLFCAIGIVVLLIALVNFINFMVSLIPLRMKAMNIQRILGHSQASLRWHIILETTIIISFSILIAYIIAISIGNLGLVSYLNNRTIIPHNILLVYILCGVALFTGILSGLYPALYSTSQPVSLVQKGAFSFSRKGRNLRNISLGFQFTISIILLTTACFMNLQYRMLQNLELGFNKDQIIQVKLNMPLLAKQETLQNNIRQHVAVVNTAVTTTPFFLDLNGIGWDGNNGINMIVASPGFIPLFDLKIMEGTNLISQTRDDLTGLINRKAQEVFNLKIGDILFDRKIIGVVEDFSDHSQYNKRTPFLIQNMEPEPLYINPYLYIKTSTSDYKNFIQYINKCCKELDPEFISHISFFDEEIERLYQKDKQQASLITFFSIIAILTSLAGIFGLTLFETAYRRKEIGIRKTIGATEQEILKMFNLTFLRIIVICFIIATPVSYYAIQQWLNTFANKIPVYPWIFLIVLLTITSITVLTVTVQSYKAATRNPVDAIKTE